MCAVCAVEDTEGVLCVCCGDTESELCALEIQKVCFLCVLW
jgi:hypothetical protein